MYIEAPSGIPSIFTLKCSEPSASAEVTLTSTGIPFAGFVILPVASRPASSRPLGWTTATVAWFATGSTVALK